MTFKKLFLLWLALSQAVLAADSTTNVPTVAISRDATNMVIQFKGTLQSAEAVTGPWLDVVDASTPFSPVSAWGSRFYRARTPDGVFVTNEVVEFSVSGPLQEHFELAFAGLPDGIFPPVRLKPYFDGTLVLGGFTVPVSLRVRGNSSLQECPFPKLKFKVSKIDRAVTPFAEAREVKLGTHCAEGGRGTIGRLRDQIATFREALAYEAMGELGFISPRVRRAHVEYRDTTSTNLTPMAGWAISRDALILDDVEVVGERLGGRALDDEEVAALTNANFNAQLITDLRFLHALLGNWDYTLSLDGRGLWNTEVIELAGGALVPVAGDFDLASWVTGEVRVGAPPEYRPDLPELERRAHYELDQIRQQAGATRYAAARDRFTAKRSAVETLVSGAVIDEPGRSNCLHHVSAFYEAAAAVLR
ncbi:MAG: hypothetical protein IPK15_15580 [Verrucomicrobia bacterium]|nr:hypothetical protein [Verrucomicrobiota bacterium]